MAVHHSLQSKRPIERFLVSTVFALWYESIQNFHFRICKHNGCFLSAPILLWWYIPNKCTLKTTCLEPKPKFDDHRIIRNFSIFKESVRLLNTNKFRILHHRSFFFSRKYESDTNGAKCPNHALLSGGFHKTTTRLANSEFFGVFFSGTRDSSFFGAWAWFPFEINKNSIWNTGTKCYSD